MHRKHLFKIHDEYMQEKWETLERASDMIYGMKAQLRQEDEEIKEKEFALKWLQNTIQGCIQVPELLESLRPQCEDSYYGWSTMKDEVCQQADAKLQEEQRHVVELEEDLIISRQRFYRLQIDLQLEEARVAVLARMI